MQNTHEGLIPRGTFADLATLIWCIGILQTNELHKFSHFVWSLISLVFPLREPLKVLCKRTKCCSTRKEGRKEGKWISEGKKKKTVKKKYKWWERNQETIKQGLYLEIFLGEMLCCRVLHRTFPVLRDLTFLNKEGWSDAECFFIPKCIYLIICQSGP